MKRLAILLALAALILLVTAVSAQTARITAVVLDVKARASSGAGWAAARVGQQLGSGAQVRTGKRGRCELKFPDGSIVRLAPLSDLTIAKVAGKDLSMGYGKLYARIVKGTTARIQGGTGVASIKGTVLEFDAGDLGEARERVTNVLTIFDGLADLSGGGKSREVGPGSRSRIGKDGTPSELQPLPGERFFNGGKSWWDGVIPHVDQKTTPGSSAGLQEREDTESQRNPAIGTAGYYPLQKGNVLIDVQSVSPLSRLAAPRRAALPLWTSGVALDTPSFAFGQSAPTEAFGERFYGPDVSVDLFGLASTDRSLTGIRVRPSAVWNDLYFEVGGMSWIYEEGRPRVALSEAFVKARPAWGDVTVGRQHFIVGPVNNSNFATLVGFDTADAIRWQPHYGPVRVDVGYVHDFLPYTQDHMRGWYGRAEASVLKGTLGFSAVHYNDIGTGVSLDFSLPVIPSEWDVYAEIGRDPADNDIQTFGCYFPGLYNRTEVDLFVEYAHRQGLGTLYSARAYRNLEHDWTAVLSLLARSDDDTSVSLGLIKRFE